MPAERPAANVREFVPRCMTVYCTQWASCGWKGKRFVEKPGVQPGRCPKCGKEVTA